MANRVHYIDWLRILAVLLLFPFHTSRVFNAGEPFYVKSSQVSTALTYVLAFIDVWHMPLLFFLAGAASFFALKKRTSGGYVIERVRRLLVPFLFGWLFLIPPQTWYGARFNSGYQRSFLEYMTTGDWLVWNIHDGGDYWGGFGLGHLWFILWLFVISLIALPLLASCRRESGRDRLCALAARLSKPVWWVLPALLLFLGEALPDPSDMDTFYYLALFVLGFVVMFHGGFAQTVERLRLPVLIAGLALTVIWVATWRYRDALPELSIENALVTLAGDLTVWLILAGMVGMGKHYLDRPSRALGYLATASYPIYILHQTVIVVTAFYIVQLPMGVALQWIAVLAASVVGSFIGYDIIRRLPVVRLAFGIKGTPSTGLTAEQPA